MRRVLAAIPLLITLACQPSPQQQAQLNIDQATYNSNVQALDLTLTGETTGGLLFDGSEDLNVFLSGQALRNLLKSLGH